MMVVVIVIILQPTFFIVVIVIIVLQLTLVEHHLQIIFVFEALVYVYLLCLPDLNFQI